MTKDHIRRLSRIALPLPRALFLDEGADRVRNQLNALMSPGARTLDAYTRRDFGWEVAISLYRHGPRGVASFEGISHWVWCAWKCLQTGLFNDYNDKRRHVYWAWKIHNEPGMRVVRNTLEGHLIVAGATYEKAAQYTGLELETVMAYETLFFNVLDRMKDYAYLQTIVYPNSKLEEMVRDYFNSADFADTLLRIGYNNGHDDLAWSAGMRLSPVTSTSIEEAKEQNEQLTLSMGALFLRNFGHHYTPHAMITSSRQLLAAAKMGGMDTGNSGYSDDFAEFADTILGTDVQVLEDRAEKRKREQST